jgi:hypothetical protein
MTITIGKWFCFAAFGLVACSGKDVDLGDGSGKTSSAIRYTGGCTPDNCANEAAANADCPASATLQCVPDPAAGQGSDPAGHCNLEAVCASPDAGSTPITYWGGCTPDSCANQEAACAGGVLLSTQCVPDPAAGQGSDPAGHCSLEAVCASPDAG